MTSTKVPINKLVCKVEDCDKQASRKYMCQTHYKRDKAGKPLNKPINTHNVLKYPILQHRKEYSIYRAMLDRCYRKTTPEYFRYGGRGVTVCDSWRQSFDNFYEDMGDKPDKMSLDRINPNKGYTPNNCRWATASIQSFNQRGNSKSQTGAIGVYQNASGGSYYARININNRVINLGSFKELSEAIKARKTAEIKYYGFAKP